MLAASDPRTHRPDLRSRPARGQNSGEDYLPRFAEPAPLSTRCYETEYPPADRPRRRSSVGEENRPRESFLQPIACCSLVRDGLRKIRTNPCGVNPQKSNSTETEPIKLVRAQSQQVRQVPDAGK